MMIDTHVHLEDEQYKTDLPAVLARAKAQGVHYFINPGVDMASSGRGVELAAVYPEVFAAVGIHPHEAKHFQREDLDALAQMAAGEKVVAIGEIGLDYHYDFSPREMQKACFEAQLALAVDLSLPVIIHDREAHEDTFSLVKTFAKKGLRGVIHCFSGSVEMMEAYVKLGFFIGLDGPVTFKNAKMPKMVAKAVDKRHLLAETDGPYLTPAPFRGKRNEPAYISYILKALAEIRGEGEAVLKAQLFENAKACFPKMGL